jgi:hypothetical protein
MKTFLLLFWVVLLPWGLGAVEEKPLSYPLETKKSQDTIKPAILSAIKGTATIQLRNQNKSILNRMELVLCPADIAPRIKETRDERWRLKASRAKFNDGYNNLDLNAIGSLAVKNALLRTRSDEKGLFRFEQVPPGSYVVYGQYHSNYAVAYWLVPVKVIQPGQEITLDLSEANVKEAYNLF